MALKISASIVTYRTPAATLEKVIRCAQESSVKMDIYVVDNSPTDALRAVCDRMEVSYDLTGKNLGYSKAHNRVIEKVGVSSKYLIALNPDVEFPSETVRTLEMFMDENPDVGVAMPQIRYPNGTIQHVCRLMPSPVDLILRRFWPFPSMLQKSTERYELRKIDQTRALDVPALSGCFLFLRTEALKKVGGFDENFFLYLEDYELCRRIGESYRTVYLPTAVAIHEYGKGSYRNLKLLGYHIRSAVYYFSKTGWLYDSVRRRLNQRTLQQLKEHGAEEQRRSA